MPDVLPSIGLIAGVGVAAQLLARTVRVPALILLLAGGILLGPGLGWLAPQETFGDDVLFPVVNVGVGLLLFEGGLALRFRDLGTAIRRPVVLLVTVGVLVTLVVGALVSNAVLDITTPQALLLGAIVTVSGPTVVGPLLQAARPRPPTSTVLRWEGILIDPIGASVAVTVLNTYYSHGSDEVASAGVLATAVVGLLVGGAGAVIVLALVRAGVSEDLQVALMLAMAVVVFVVAQSVRDESGLYAALVLGLALANQPFFDLRTIVGFSEHVSVIVIGALFVTLAADLQIDALLDVLPQVLLLCVGLAACRHLVVHICTRGVPGLGRRDRVFMGLLAPRGVVAAATASSFALTLEQRGSPFPELAPTVYGVVIVMGVLSAVSVPAAGWLGVRRPDPRGLLLVGSEPWVVRLAEAVATTGLPVHMVTPGRADLEELHIEGVRIVGSSLSRLASLRVLDEVEYCITATGAVETQTYVWNLARDVLGGSRVLAVPIPGEAPIPGLPRAFPHVQVGALRDAVFEVSHGAVPPQKPGDFTTILGVTADRRLLLRPSGEPSRGEWTIAAVQVPALPEGPGTANELA